MSKERFKHIENDIVNYIDDDKTGITYIATNYYDMKNLTELLNKQDQKISDLEAKLAESEKKFKASKDAIKFQSEEQKEWMDKYFNTAIKLEKLEQQLAEKERWINTYFVSQTNKPMIQPTQDQDKISFAVEQLEKVKAKYPRGTISWGIGKSEDGFEYVSDFIDNQIEELKKGGR